MIVDSSALMAILTREPDAEIYAHALAAETDVAMSAGTHIELSVVIDRRRMEDGLIRLDRLLDTYAVGIAPVTAEQATLARRAQHVYGRSRHPAGLNYGDLFSYALAKSTGRPLLFKGRDFAQTDITPALRY